MTHAIRFHKTGGPEVLVWEEVAKELEDGLAKGPYVAETFPVHVEDSYVIIET